MSKKNEIAKAAPADLASPLEEADLMVSDADMREVARLIKDEGYAVEKVVTLEEGKQIRGVFVGEGGPIEVNSPSGGGKQAVRTWRIKAEAGNMVAVLLSCAQFESRFGKMAIGTHVHIIKNPKVRTNAGTFANDFTILTKEPANSGGGALPTGVL